MFWGAPADEIRLGPGGISTCEVLATSYITHGGWSTSILVLLLDPAAVLLRA